MILISAAAEAVALYFDARGPAFALPLTVLTVIQFSITPMLPVFFVGALGMWRPAIVASTAFCLHAVAQIVSAPFGWIFRYDAMGTYIRGPCYGLYQACFISSLVFLIVCLVIVGRRFKHRDLFTIGMIFVVMAAALLLNKVYTNYIGIGMCASLCYIYYNGLKQDIQLALIANQEKMSRIQEHIISGLANPIEYRDMETGEHVVRTSRYVRALSEFARADHVYADQLTDHFVAQLARVAPLHDAGKIVVPETS